MDTHTVDVEFSPQAANAARRHLLTSVPTMAIDEVHITTNTSFVPTELVAHRISMLPLAVDAALFSVRGPFQKRLLVERASDAEALNEKEVLAFELVVRAPEDSRTIHTVRSSDLTWVPLGAQASWLPATPAAVHANVPVVMLTAGQEICCKMLARRGVASAHPKWGAVTVAHYLIQRRVRLVDATRRYDDETIRKILVHAPEEVLRAGRGGRLSLGPAAECFYEGWEGGLPEEARGVLRVDYVPTSVRFTVESNGVYDPERLMAVGLEAAQNSEKTRDMRERASALKAGDMVRLDDSGRLGTVVDEDGAGGAVRVRLLAGGLEVTCPRAEILAI